MIPALLLAALCVYAVGAVVDIARGPKGPVFSRAPYILGGGGSILVTVAGVLCVLRPPRTFSLGSTFGISPSLLRFDGLAGLFLTLCGGLGVCVCACLVSWTGVEGRMTGRGTGAGLLLLLGAVAAIFVAGDAFTFLFAWELVTLAFYVLTAARREAAGATASWVTLGIGKFSGAALLLGLLVLAGRTRSLAFASFALVPHGAAHAAAYTLLVVGFAAKVGTAPFQVWLPRAYPAAQGPVRAAMAGLAVNVGFYGLWRFLGILGSPPLALAVVVLVVGGATALVGIAFATVQSSLNRVIAYSSVENAGLILVGYGVALAGATAGDSRLVAVGLLAGSLQVLAHSVAKSGLFASSAFFTADEGTDDLERLKGIGRRYVVSGVTFGLGALTLAGLPPTIGFVSEWFLLEALLQEFRLRSLALRLGMAAAGALVALTIGVAVLAFVRVLGLCILGRSRETVAAKRLDGGVLGRGGLIILATACLGLAAASPWVVRYLSLGLSPVVAQASTASALRSPWVLQPVYANFSILSPPWLFVVMPVAFLSVLGLGFALSRGRFLRVRRVPAWRSATRGVAGPDSYTPYAFANSIRHVLGNVLGAEHTIQVLEDDPAGEMPSRAHVEVSSTVVEPIETYLYRPAIAAYLWLAGVAKRLQSGRLGDYIAYMLLALMAVLVAVGVSH